MRKRVRCTRCKMSAILDLTNGYRWTVQGWKGYGRLGHEQTDIVFCPPCEKEFGAGEGETVPDWRAFWVACDRCESETKHDEMWVFDEWGRGLPGERGVGRCKDCDALCSVCGRALPEDLLEWTQIARARVCSTECLAASR